MSKDSGGWPKWIPYEDECIWCRRHTLVPVETETKDQNFTVYYECTNEECEHQKRYESPALYGLKFSGSNFGVQFAEFMKQQTEEKRNESRSG